MNNDRYSLSVHDRRTLLRDVFRYGCDAPPTAVLNDDEQQLLNSVFNDYHACLKQTPAVWRFLNRHKLHHPEMIKSFRLGYTYSSVCRCLPSAGTLKGYAIRGTLRRLGVLRPTGREHFQGALIVPAFDDKGNVIDAYGRLLAPKLRRNQQGVYHLGLFQPSRGLFNASVLSLSSEIILCASVLDALSFWCAGMHNVVAIFGLMGLYDSQLSRLAQAGTQRAILVIRHDEKGNRVARCIAQQLFSVGMRRRIQRPCLLIRRNRIWLSSRLSIDGS